MFSAPMFRREYRAATRGRRPFALRATLAVVLGLIMLAAGYVLFQVVPAARMTSADRVLYFGRTVFLATIVVELLFLLFFVPSLVGGAVAEEREKDTLSMLLLTRLRPVEIVAIKAFARWVPVFNLLLAGLPALVVGGWLAGLGAETFLAMLALASTSAFMSALAILASAQREQVGTARSQAMGWIFGWMLVPPVLSVMPVATGQLWGDLLAQLKDLCVLVAPSSPLSILTDVGWYYRRPGALSLEGRIAQLVGLQAAFGLLALVLASGRLQAREKNPNWIDPSRGYRPPCGDDPIFWREFDLPMRRGGGSLIALRLRYLWILIRAILISAFALFGTLILLAVPIGILIATAHYGFAAFRELWQNGYALSGPFVERDKLGLLMRAATSFLAFFPCLVLCSLVSGRITTERDKKTWDAFLTTPLEAGEILGSKARVAWQVIWHSARPLPILWGLGIACGVLTPPGVALAAVDLAVAAWASIALGLCLGLRPGETTAASNRASMAMLVVLLLHAPVLWVALASWRELAATAAWDPRLRWGLAAAVLAIPTATGLIARSLDRRARDRFDEWTGRPHAGGLSQPPPTPVTTPELAVPAPLPEL